MIDVAHNWQPSSRLRKLMDCRGVTLPRSTSSAYAVAWLIEHEALFSSKQHCTRALTIIRYRLANDLTIDQLRAMIRKSWIRDGRVQGDLANVHNLGVTMFNELKRVLGD